MELLSHAIVFESFIQFAKLGKCLMPTCPPILHESNNIVVPEPVMSPDSVRGELSVLDHFHECRAGYSEDAGRSG